MSENRSLRLCYRKLSHKSVFKNDFDDIISIVKVEKTRHLSLEREWK